MNRTTTALVFLVSLIIVGAGAFYAGQTLGGEISTTDKSEAIVEEAKQRILSPVLPPKPAGREVVVQKNVETTIAVPAPSWGNPTRVQQKKITTSMPETKLV